MSKLNDITKIPIQVLNILTNYVDLEDKLFERVATEQELIKYVGKGINNSAYFSIISYQITNSKVILNIEYSPSSEMNTKKLNTNVVASGLDAILKKWTNLLSKYVELSEVFMESKRFSEIIDEIYDSFDVPIEQENEYFTVDELVKIDTTIDALDKWIEAEKENFLPVLYKKIKTELDETRGGLAEKTKGWIVKKVSKILGVIVKQSPRFIKGTAVEVLKLTLAEVIKTRLIGH